MIQQLPKDTPAPVKPSLAGTGAAPAAPPVAPKAGASGLVNSILAEFRQVFSKDNPHLVSGLTLTGLLLVLTYAYGNMLLLTVRIWRDPLYSFGWMVPVAAVVMLWVLREPLKKPSNLERWLGVAIVAVALLARTWFGIVRYNTPNMYTFPIAIAGVFVFMGGWDALRWSWRSILFLYFMFPMAMPLERGILFKLQERNTIFATFALQTLGVPAYHVGNVITIEGVELQVEEACAGLRMTTVLVAMCVAFALWVPMRWWERIILLVSGIPIALAANLIRIVLTSLLYLIPGVPPGVAQWAFHDGGGYFMVVIALGLAYLEWVVISKLIIEEAPRASQPKIGINPTRPGRVGTMPGK